MIWYEKLADHFLNVYFSGFKWPELVSKVLGTIDLSCTGIELHFFLSANFTDICSVKLAYHLFTIPFWGSNRQNYC